MRDKIFNALDAIAVGIACCMLVVVVVSVCFVFVQMFIDSRTPGLVKGIIGALPAFLMALGWLAWRGRHE